MEGHDHIAPLMAERSDLAIFRKFSILNYRMLLYTQAELIEQEARLIAAIEMDQSSGHEERRQFAFNFRAMLYPVDDSEDARLQKKIMDEIRPVLKDYNALLLQNYELGALPCVHKPDLECLRDELRTGPQPGVFLRGHEMKTWHREKEYDLVSLNHRNRDRDPISSWLAWCITDVYHKYWGHKRRPPIVVDNDWKPAMPATLTIYPDKDVARCVTTITTMMAPILPTTSASVLFFIDDQLTRLGVAVLLSFVFSGALALVGLPRRIDSFVATATFTALLIVFVSNNTDCSC